MDISTIRSNLSNYPNINSALDDMRLIWKNSYLYNDPESETNLYVDILSPYMEKLVVEYFGAEFYQKPLGKHASTFFPACGSSDNEDSDSSSNEESNGSSADKEDIEDDVIQLPTRFVKFQYNPDMSTFDFRTF